MTRAVCWACGMTFSCDPELVPAMPLDARPVAPIYGLGPGKAALCWPCIVYRLNPERERQGRPAWFVEPGAYLGANVYEGVYG